MADRALHPRTLAARALGHSDAGTGAVVPALHTATTYLRDPDNAYRSGFDYARGGNPTFTAPEALLTRLEGGADTRLFGSGMAAATAVLLALRPGDRVVAPKVMYWSLRNWLSGPAREWGLQVEFADMGNPAELAAAIRRGGTALVWLETPANPLWDVTDIAETARLAHEVGALVAVDNTVATPVLTRPLALGADLVMHSATKSLNGHSDVLAGALVTARTDGFWERIRANRNHLGAVPGPFEAHMLLRGMRTLHLRVEAACRNAAAVASHFRGHPKVLEVLYPGLPEHPGHGIAVRQMEGGFGSMLSLRVVGGEAVAVRTAANVSVWTRATSLGGVESLIEHRASVEGPGTPVPKDLLRLSAGIEHVDDLIDDLERALAVRT